MAINPTPTLNSSLTPPAFCSGIVFSYTPTSATTGATFTWTRAVVAGISNTAGSGTDNPNEVLTNTVSVPVNVKYIYTVSANGCTNSITFNVIVPVNPNPTVNSTTTPPGICSGTVFSYAPTSATSGATFSWTRAAVAGISQIAGGGFANPLETLTNTTTASVNVTYIYTVSANGCTNETTFNIVVAVFPTPVLSSSLTPPAVVCGAAFNYTPTSEPTGASFSWSRAVVTGISNIAASGAGDPNEILNNTTIDPINVTYIYTVSANGCTNGTTFSVVFAVNPTPILSSTLTPPAICSNTAFSYTPNSATIGASFAWTRAAVGGISQAAGSGMGNPLETLTNTTISPVNVTYIYTLSANGCTNPTTFNVVVTVNLIPTLNSSLTAPAICSGISFSYAPTSLTLGASFTWTRAAVTGISNISGNGTGNPNEILTNTTQDPISVTYNYTVAANGCINTTPYNVVVVVVNPTPSLSSSLTPPAICSGTAFNYGPTSETSGATYAWSRAVVTGISNINASGIGSPGETLINTTVDPVNVTYIYTVSANGCTNVTTYSVIVAVNPAAGISSTLAPPAICNGTAFNYTPLSATAGASFSWTRAVVAGVSNGAGSGIGNPLEILNNTTTSLVNVNYVYSVSANGCTNPVTYSVVVTVNPTPTLSSSLTTPDICSGTSFSYVPTSGVSGASFTWTRAAVTGISNVSGSGIGNPNEVLNNTTGVPVDVTYVYTVSANLCTNPSTYNVVVKVNFVPKLTSTLTPNAMCSGNTFSYTPTTDTPPATFSWTRAVVAGLSNIAGSGTGNPQETLILSDTIPVNVTYVYTLSNSLCTNLTTYNVVIRVNKPCICNHSLSSSLAPPAVCNNSEFNYIPTSETSGASFSWTRAAVVGISNTASSGTFNPQETLINTTANPINVIYNYSITANSCTNPTTFDVVVAVNPTPTLSSSLAPPTICSGLVFTYVPTSATTGSTYGWTRGIVVGISNAAGIGTGNINEILTNTTPDIVSVTYVYTVSANGCTNPTTYSVVVDVIPAPTLSSTLVPPPICSETPFIYTPTSATVGGSLAWTRAVIGGISNAAGSGSGDPNEVLINTTPSPVNVTYVYTISANGCVNPVTYSVVVTVYPTPTLTSTSTPPPICNGTVFIYVPASATAAVAFSWTRAVVTGISNIAGSGTGNPNEILTNTTATPLDVEYIYTLSANGCTNATTYSVIVTVNPSPKLNSTLTPPTICSGTIFSYTPTSATTGADFSWNRPSIGGLSELQSSGTGDPNETLTNLTTFPLYVTYSYQITANNCSYNQNVVVGVNPAPTLTSSISPPSICSGDVFNYSPVSGTSGATFTWTRAVVSGISNIAGFGSGNPTEVLINTTASPIDVTYIYTVTANGCANPITYNVVVTVNTPPVLSSTLTPPSICDGTAFYYLPSSATSGTSFFWERQAVAGISNPTSLGTGDPIEILNNTTLFPVNVTYIYTVSANGCGNNQNVIVTVNPTPTLSSTLAPPEICSGTVFNYTATSDTPGATYTWSRVTVIGISNAAANGTGDPNEILINTTSAPLNVIYVYKVSANGCTNPSSYNVVVLVNPTPTLSSSLTPPAICSGTAFNYTPTSATPGTFAWTRAVVVGVSNPIDSGSGNPNEILINTSSAPVNVTYVYTVTANGCTNPFTYSVVVEVNPIPTLTSSVSPPAICNNTTFNYEPTSATIGTSFAWSRAVVAGISNAAASGTGDPNEILVNSTSSPINVTYIYTLAANGCSNPSTYSVVVSVNLSCVCNHSLSSSLAPPDVCSGTVFSYTPTSLSPGATFTWTRAAVIGISNASGSGTEDPLETLINTTASPINVSYDYLVTANSCTNAIVYTVVVTINPTPALSSSLLPPSICNGASFNYTPTGATSGASYSWTRATVIGISNAAASGIGNPLETLTNITVNPVSATYVYTVAANGCINPSTYNVVITVTPAATLSSSLTPPAICSGTVLSYTPTSAIAGATFEWTRAAVAGITNLAGNGTDDPNETLTNTTAAPINVTYIYNVSANGCANTSPYSVVVPVNPTPTLSSSLSPPAICSGTVFSYIPNSVTAGATFSWTRAVVPGITSAAANGTGDPIETLSNTTVDPITVTYIYTVTANGCINPSTFSVAVIVNPAPTLSSTLSPSAICSGTPFSYTPASATSGAIFSWYRAPVTGISQPSANGTNDPNETLTNLTTFSNDVTYNYNIWANGCLNSQNVIVTVNPRPTLSSSITLNTMCSGAVFSYSPANATAGASFEWTRAAVSGISNAASNGTGDPNEILADTTSFPVDVTYIYTITANGCVNPTTYSIVVRVNPTLILSSSLSPPTICSGTIFYYLPTSATPGATFNWTRAAVTGISNPGSIGTGDPIETLTNTTADTVDVTYVYTISANGCNTSQNVIVTVNPTPVLSSTLAPPAICSGTVFNYTATSTTAGASYVWSRIAVIGISNAAANGTGDPNETLINTTPAPLNVVYVYTVAANGCTNSKEYSVVVLVNPTPTLSSSLTPPAICSETAFNYTPTSATPGTFAWTRAVVVGISNPADSGSGNPNEILINTSSAPVNVTYVYTVTANGCTNPTTFSVVVVVNPVPVLSSSVTPPAICNNTVFNYIPTGATIGTSFAWTRAVVAGISNVAASGTGDPNETLVNTTAAPVNVTYVYTLSANGCTNPTTYNVVVSVNLTCACNHALSSSLAPPAICSGTLISYTPTSPSLGASFTWTRSTAIGISNPASSGTDDPNEILINTTANPVNVSYDYLVTANSCTNAIVYSVIVTVNPTPKLSSSISPPAICSGVIFNYTPSGATAGATYAWSRAAVIGISNASNTGIANPLEALTNISTNPVSATYVYTISANGCINPSTYNVVVTVTPAATLSSSLTPPAICSGTIFSYTPTSAIAGASFDWSRAVVGGITDTANSGTDDPNEILTNTTAAPINVTYVYNVSANGCGNTAPYNIIVPVNPTPALSSSLAPPAICSGTVFNYIPGSATAVATFGWTRALITGISNAAANGIGDPNETLINTTVDPITITYIYTVTANGCINPSTYSVEVVVNPSPILNTTLSPAPICSGTVFSYTPGSATAGASFAWNRGPVTGISEPSTAGINDPNETLTNLTSFPNAVTYSYTITANGCAYNQNVILTVNPTPILSSTITSAEICSGSIFSYLPISATAGTSFNWTRAAVPGIGNPAGSGTDNPNEVLTDTTALPVNVTYVYSLAANGCTNASTYSIVVTVNPSPTLSSTLTPPSICNNTAFYYLPTSSIPGTTFSWTRAAVPGISNPASIGTDDPIETLTNTSNAPVNVTYVYTVSANGCTNPTGYEVVVTVNLTCICTHSLSSTLTPPPICSGSVFDYTPTSGSADSTFTWTRAAVIGISNAASSGMDNPNETLINATENAINVSYVYTVSAMGCTNPTTFSVVVIVNPIPKLSSSFQPPVVCIGEAFNYTPLSLTAGASFDWSRAAVTGISNSPGSGINNPNEILINTTTDTVGVTYLYSVSANGCPNPTTFSVVVVVDPPTVGGIVSSNTTVCYGSNSGTLLLNGHNGNVIKWQSSYDGGISWGDIINLTASQTYNNLTVTTIYHAVVQRGACASVNSGNDTVTVSPLSVGGTVSGNAEVCEGANTTGTLNLSGYVGNVVNWASSTDGILWTPTVPINSSAAQTYTTLTATTWFRAWVKSGVCSSDTSTVSFIKVNPKPEASFSAAPVCNGETTILNPVTSISSGSIQYYIWDFGDFTSFTSTTVNTVVPHTYANSATYLVSFTVSSDKGCVNTISNAVIVNTKPDAQITSDGPLSFCFGVNTNLYAATPAMSYLWSTGSTASGIVADSSGTYTLTVTDPINGCSDTDSIIAVAFPPMLTNSISDTSISLGTSVTLNGGVGMVYSWSPAIGLNNPGIANPVATPEASTTYILTLTDANNCVSIDSITITVTDDYDLKIPNLITPNGDGYNDVWIIKNIEKYPGTELIIVNVEGKEVYFSSAYDNTWGGTNMNGNPLPDGTYYYFIKFLSSEKLYKGPITILNDIE